MRKERANRGARALEGAHTRDWKRYVNAYGGSAYGGLTAVGPHSRVAGPEPGEEFSVCSVLLHPSSAVHREKVSAPQIGNWQQ